MEMHWAILGDFKLLNMGYIYLKKMWSVKYQFVWSGSGAAPGIGASTP